MADDALRIRLVAWPLLITVIPILTPDDIGITVINMEGKMNTTMMKGMAAIEYAEAAGIGLRKFADPTEGARESINPSEARDIAAQDAGLIHCEVTAGDLRGIRSLAQQDTAGDVDDSYSRTGDAEDTIYRWRAAARQANDTDLIALIDRLGIPVAASIYAAARA